MSNANSLSIKPQFHIYPSLVILELEQLEPRRLGLYTLYLTQSYKVLKSVKHLNFAEYHLYVSSIVSVLLLITTFCKVHQ